MNEKTLVFDNGGAMDGNLVAALMNGNNRNNGYGNGYGWEWMWMILLWALWGGNGWGGFGGRVRTRRQRRILGLIRKGGMLWQYSHFSMSIAEVSRSSKLRV